MMKRIFLLAFLFVWAGIASAQEVYWVFFTDKQGQETAFDPYAFFDEKAIQRREKLEISLLDSTDYPLKESYVTAVSHLSEEVIGESRWFNALAVSTYQIDKIRRLPFVASVEPIQSQITFADTHSEPNSPTAASDSAWLLCSQLLRMQGEMFAARGIDGTGIRIAVIDAGFKTVDQHPAFQHLREKNLIKQTYNFKNKTTDVYTSDEHGTMVLSCITGVENGRKLGLATGAEFLLAVIPGSPIMLDRSEVAWVMALEWADRNGADIVSSSIGYARPQYTPADMDGTSRVAKAANMAAAKGILVCNSMGNEGNNYTWLTLNTPADADSVLTVGGIAPWGNPSWFTSWGPTADGRLKPNVCAYGHAYVAKATQKEPYYTQAEGTSFASPLVAGFAACAWQLHPDLNNMELKSEIEKSGDNYPQHSWQLGFGVPQASHFTKDRPLYVEYPQEPIKDTTEVPQVISSRKNYYFDIYINWGFVAPTCAADFKPLHYGKSESFLAGYRFRGYIREWYSLGAALEIGATWYIFKQSRLDGGREDQFRYVGLKKENIRVSYLSAEFFQRFRLWKKAGYSESRYDGLFVDVGLFAGWNFSIRHNTDTKDAGTRTKISTKAADMSPFQWGVRARLGYGIISAYAQYRFNRLDKRLFYSGEKVQDFPSLEVGIQLVIHLDWSMWWW